MKIELIRQYSTHVVVSMILLFIMLSAPAAWAHELPDSVRFATFNASLNRSQAGQLVTDLSTPNNVQARTIAEIIQRTRPDVLLINEFDYDKKSKAAQLFQDNYLSISQNGAEPINYGYRFVALSNTGISSGFDLDNNGSIGGGNDALGFGDFPGQYGMVVYSKYPIDHKKVRTFQKFLWKDMPGALLPDNPATAPPADWYSPDELRIFRLSSKSHWDLPIVIGSKTVHFLVSHPTPPVFDGPEDRNGTRNHDEIRFWADYIDQAKAGYIYDDKGKRGGLATGELFVIAGDQNADPLDGDSTAGAIQQLLNHPLVNTSVTPSSPGAVEQAQLQGGANTTHKGDPKFDTADFADTAPGNLRADYVLPHKNLTILDAKVFWPTSTDPLFALVGVFPFPSSDHRLVTVDVSFSPAPSTTPIYAIQGEGQRSPFEGQDVTTSGIVTLIGDRGRSFWLQDAVGDNNPRTSDGLYIFRNAPAGLAVGDYVLVQGKVSEYTGSGRSTDLPLTEIAFPTSVQIISKNNPLPHPVKLDDLPNESIPEGIDFWESLEGMRVEVKNARVVGPTNNFNEFVMLARKDTRPGSGYEPRTKQILVSGYHGFVDYNPERIMVDDFTFPAQTVRPGDKIAELVGVVDYSFGNYKLQPASILGLDAQPVPPSPVSKRSGAQGNLTITTFNVENLFDTADDPNKDDTVPSAAQLETKLAKLTLAIQQELNLPDIILIEEVENETILQELGNRVNAVAGTNYKATSFEASDGRSIQVGFLWDDNRLDLVQAFQLTDAIVPGVSAAFGPASASPGREPLVGKFNVTGNVNDPQLTIIANHFKSKGGDEPLFGVNQPPNRGTEAQRKLQAQVVRDYVNLLFKENPEAWILVGGDLNDFQFGEPGEGEDHPLAILEGRNGEVPLENLIYQEHEAERFTYVFDGNSQVLDHLLVSPAFHHFFKALDILHFNASYPPSLGSNAATSLRVSDHDSVEGRFKVNKVEPALTLTLLETNDGETKLISAPSSADFGGVARLKTLIDKLRAEAMQGPGKRAVILLSGADNYIPGPQFNASLDKGVPFYDTVALKLIGYDATAIGNHEFDLGPDVFADFIQGFEGTLPFVSSNLDFSQEPRLQDFVEEDILVKSHVIEKSDERIGIVGVTTPLLPVISSPRNVVVDPNFVATIQEEIDRLQKKHVNKIIIIGQLQGINEDITLASKLHGVDIIVSGGGQELLANPGNLLVPQDPTTPFGPFPMYATGADGAKIPVVTTNGDYKYVGRLVVSFDKEGRIIAVDPTSGPVRVSGVAPDAVIPDPELQAQVVQPVQAYLDGQAANIIATSEVALDGRRSPGVRTQETNLGNLMVDSLLWQANQLADAFGAPQAQVAFQNGGGIRNNSLIPAGPISELTAFSIAPFLNFVAIVPNIPPAQFKEIMENAVSKVANADGRFAQISGFKLIYDPTGTAQVVDNAGNVLTPGNRVVEIRLDDDTLIVQNGAVVAGAPSVNVATIDFLANGGDQYPFRGAPFIRLGATYLQALQNYMITALNRQITATDYPESGEGRITTLPPLITLTTMSLVEPTAELTPTVTVEPTAPDTPTPEPTTTDTPTIEPTFEPPAPDTPTPEPPPTDTPAPETTPADTPTPEPTPTETPTPEPTPTDTPAAEPTAEPTGTGN
jgi:5'-nucleotidase